MLVNIGPILIALFAGLLLGEGFPRWLVIGAVVAFAGAVLVGAATAGGGSSDLLGSVLCVVAAVTYAIGVLAQKPTLRRLPALQVTWLATTIGAPSTERAGLKCISPSHTPSNPQASAASTARQPSRPTASPST